MAGEIGGLRPYIWMLTGSLSFSFMAAFAHAAGQSWSWQVIALARTGLCLVFMTILAQVWGVRLVFWRPATLWLRSIAGSISLVCTFYSLTHLQIAYVLTLTNVFPIWVAILSWPLLRETPSPRVWLSVASGVLGVGFIQSPDLTEGNYAALVALCSSLTTALAMMGLHRLQDVDARAIVVHFSAVSALFCAVATLLEPGQSPERVHGAADVLLLLGVGVTATIGQFFLTKAFAAGTPAKVSVVGLSQVVFAMVIDFTIFDKSFKAFSLVGIFLILGPTAWLMLRPERMRPEPDEAAFPIS
jgi:drug/metabolite transporter (DMT)-like permease